MKIKGQELIATERARQIEVEGWSASHDDGHGADLIQSAAECYRDAVDRHANLPAAWPWDASWWKPKDRVANLVRAGALYKAAADVAERLHDFEKRNELLVHVENCANLIDSQ